MKVKQKSNQKETSDGAEESSNDNVGTNEVAADVDEVRDKPPDVPDFDVVIKLLRGYLEMITQLNHDGVRDLVNQGEYLIVNFKISHYNNLFYIRSKTHGID